MSETIQPEWKESLARTFGFVSGDGKPDANYLEVMRDLDGATVLFEASCSGGYEEDITILYEKNGTLYEVRGSHCSCNDFNGQWNPGEITFEYLARMLGREGKNRPFYLTDKDDDELRRIIAERAPAEANS